MAVIFTLVAYMVLSLFHYLKVHSKSIQIILLIQPSLLPISTDFKDDQDQKYVRSHSFENCFHLNYPHDYHSDKDYYFYCFLRKSSYFHLKIDRNYYL